MPLCAIELRGHFKLHPARYSVFGGKLFTQIQQDHPDATETVLATLLLHKGFTEDGSKKAASVYKENVEFIAQFAHVGLKETPITQPVKPSASGGVAISETKPNMMQAVTANELPVPIGDNLIARVPFPMTEEDFDLFIGTLNLWKKKLVKAPLAKPRVDTHIVDDS